MKKTQGFTLIETVIVLAIAGILTSYAMPSFQQLKLNKIMENERNRLTSTLQYARNKAVMNQSNIIVCPSISGNSCDNQSNWYQGWIVFTDYNSNRTFDENDKVLLVEDAMPKEIIVTSSTYRQKIRYNSMGFSPGTNLSINFCDQRGDEFAQSIIVSNSGRVKQSKPNANNVCS